MASSTEIIVIGIIERDINNDVLWIWSYPSVTGMQRRIALNKCSFHAESLQFLDSRFTNFVYSHYQKTWCYMYTTDVNDAKHLPRVKQVSLVLWSKDFNPEKYEFLIQILSKAYIQSGNPARVGHLCLAVMTQGSCSTEDNGTFQARDFDPRHAYASASIKNVISMFKLETILIYTAIILKKRVVVYHHKLNNLLQFTRALPAFVWHRQDWNILYPYVDLVEDEIQDLKSVNSYVAGFLDASVESRSDLYDIFINLAAVEITVAPHAKDFFNMSKCHKEIALFMVHCSEDESLTDQQIIKEIANKTKELLQNLLYIGSEGNGRFSSKIILESLQERKLAPALENFLFNLAVAENVIELNK